MMFRLLSYLVLLAFTASYRFEESNCKKNDPQAYVTEQYEKQILSEKSKEEIAQFVLKESIAFKKSLHPLFKNIETGIKDSIFINNFNENPYVVLDTQLIHYRYAPENHIVNLKIGNTYFTNLFSVYIHPRFLLKDKEKRVNMPDTLYPFRQDWVKMNLFGNDDRYYIVYYCQSNNTLVMLGGNAYLSHLDHHLFKSMDAPTLRGLMTYIRLRHSMGAEAEVYTNYSHLDDNTGKDSTLEIFNEAKKYIYLEGAPIGGIRLYRPFPISTFVRVPYNSVGIRTYESDVYRCAKWDHFEYYRYLKTEDMRKLFQRCNWSYQLSDAFPYYELKNVVFARPKSYQDVAPAIRGVSKQELDRMKAAHISRGLVDY